MPGSGGSRELLGGWRFTQAFARGAIAMDFSRNKLFMVGHAQRNEILEFNLPTMGSGSNVDAWPRVDPVSITAPWWPMSPIGGTYAHGLLFWRGKLWVSPRTFYDQPPYSSEPLTIYARDGESMTFPNLPRQIFSGFVKRGPGLDPYLGGGGYESGQGTVSGPTLATLGGQVIITHSWLGTPGGNLENWNTRAPREPNYTMGGSANDGWMGWEPRTVNGVREGRWASDRIYGGGLALPEGITYYPWMATGGPLLYQYQTYTFVPDEDNRTYEYRYTPGGQFISYQHRSDIGQLPVYGQELGPDGKIYLAVGNSWQSDAYKVDIAVRVFA